MKSQDGDNCKPNGKLTYLCLGIFIFFGITSLFLKYFSLTTESHLYIKSTLFLGFVLCLALLVASFIGILLGWHKTINQISLKVRARIMISGLCTAVSISSLLILYSYRKISVMLAAIIMSALVILSGRLTDYILIRKKIIQTQFNKADNTAIIFSLSALLLNFIEDLVTKRNSFSAFVIIIFIAYFFSFSLRIYIMNLYKNVYVCDLGRGGQFSKLYFVVERIYASIAFFIILLITTTIIFINDSKLIWDFVCILEQWERSSSSWIYFIIITGTAFGIGTLFSVLVLMYKNINASAATIINRSTILLSAIFVTILFEILIFNRRQTIVEYISLVLIAISFYYIRKAGKIRQAAK